MTAMTTQDIILIIGALGIMIVNTINAWKTQAKVAQVDDKADNITGHVNGARRMYESKIEALHLEVIGLREQISEMKEAAALLAQAKIHRDRERNERT